MTSSPIYTKLYITKPRLVILILNNSTEVQFHNQYKRKTCERWMCGAGWHWWIAANQETKKLNLEQATVCDQNTL